MVPDRPDWLGEGRDYAWSLIGHTADINKPLDVAQYQGQFSSISNRRLTALMMYQGLHRDVCVKAWCRMCSHDTERFDMANDTMNNGLSIGNSNSISININININISISICISISISNNINISISISIGIGIGCSSCGRAPATSARVRRVRQGTGYYR